MGKNINDFVSELKKIKKDKLDERTFYVKVLRVIKTMDGFHLTPENFEILKSTLLEIGCQTFADWKKETEKRGEKVSTRTIGEGIELGTIETAVSFVSQLLSTYENASFSLPYMLDGGEEYGWVQSWIRNNEKYYGPVQDDQDKLQIPYYKVAKHALMNWNGLTEEEAEKVIREQTLLEIDNQVWAKGSMDSALRSIVSSLKLTEKEEAMLNEITYTGITDENKEVINTIKQKIIAQGTSINTVIIDTLFAVHDGWVESNGKKFLAREKKHQHMPSELIGWNEAKADLLFIKPIFEALGYEISEEELEKEYYRRVKEFFLNRRVEKEEDLVNLISRGEEFYPALRGQTENIRYLKNKENVRTVVLPQIAEKGIGTVSDVRRKILDEIKITVRDEDLIRLSEAELTTIEEELSSELDALESEGEYGSKKYLATKIRLYKVINIGEIVRKRIKANNSEEE